MGSMTDSDNPFLKPREEIKRRCYVLFVGNRGLCGVYNSSLLHYAEQIARRGGHFVGRWGRDSILRPQIVSVRRVFDGISDTPTAQGDAVN